jgi:hypothetical protein
MHFYVLRDARGHITSLHRGPVEGAQPLSNDHPDVLAFTGREAEQARFSEMDAGLVRVVEDLIDALIRRNVLCITDLPLEAQLKLFDRKHFREGLQDHSLELLSPAQARQHDSDTSTLGAVWSDISE